MITDAIHKNLTDLTQRIENHVDSYIDVEGRL